MKKKTFKEAENPKRLNHVLKIVEINNKTAKEEKTKIRFKKKIFVKLLFTSDFEFVYEFDAILNNSALFRKF